MRHMQWFGGALLLALPQVALACGGFFCDTAQPVDQAGEKIAFFIDQGEVEVHVQIEFEGDAEEFAWVVPAPAEPVLSVGTDALFTQMDALYGTRFQLNFVDLGNCFGIQAGGGVFAEMAFAESDDSGNFAPEDENGVSVVGRAAVGPYDTVTLQADSAELLEQWLIDNGYDVPETMDQALAPYVANGAYFVALKLQSGRTTGELTPLAMRYTGTTPSIPIQLTSIAAVDDMPITVSVFGDQRAVPSNYLHLDINEAAVDWLGGGTNYFDTIALAADEAGGHGFTTGFAGTPDQLPQALLPDWLDLASVRNARNAGEAVEYAVNATGLGPGSLLGSVLAQHIDFGDLDIGEVMAAPWQADALYGQPVDGEALADAIQADVIPVREHLAEITGSLWMSRMTSSLSANEMTLDPMFELTSSIERVDFTRNADLVRDCRTHNWENAPRWIELADGRTIALPPENEMEDFAEDSVEAVSTLRSVGAIAIERAETSGSFKMERDNSEQADAALKTYNDWVSKTYYNNNSPWNCGGCQSGGMSFGGLALLGLVGLRRRRS